jgi:hypothetical protein
MTTTNADILRHEDTTANLPSTSRNKQTTYETDGNRRQRHATADGAANFWTPDEKFVAELVKYIYASLPSIATVKDALDYLLANAMAGSIVPIVAAEPDPIVGSIVLYALDTAPTIIIAKYPDGSKVQIITGALE